MSDLLNAADAGLLKRRLRRLATAAVVAGAASAILGRLQRRSQAPSFELPALLKPVHHDPTLIDYSNGPVSAFRPKNQFIRRRQGEQPVITLITATYNTRPETIQSTYESLRRQSLQLFRWIIVNDHSKSPDTALILDRLARQDTRITVAVNDGKRGLPAARNKALEIWRSTGATPYVANLDDDDQFELTALEKLVWMLESNRNWDLAGFFWLKYGVSG